MRFLLVCFCHALVLSLLGAAHCAAQNFVPLDPKEVELKAQQLNGPILPYQAVRVRLSIRNISSKKLGPLASIDRRGQFVWGIKRPGDAKYYEPGLLILYERFVARNTSVPTARDHFDTQFPLFLNPGEIHSQSVAFGMQRTENGKDIPCFPSAGTYSLKCGFDLEPEKKKVVYKFVPVKVLEPKGVDGLVYDLLKKDPELRAELMQANINPPAPESYVKLKKLVEHFPKSSYIPYVRLALARCCLTGKGPKIASGRVAAAMAADELEKAARPRYDPDLKLFSFDDFPFRPQALAIHASLFDRDRSGCLAYLHRDHRDSLQWINEFARLMQESSSSSRLRFDLDQVIEGALPMAVNTGDIWRWFRTQ